MRLFTEQKEGDRNGHSETHRHHDDPAIFQARAQFGDAIKAHWFYDGDGCPGCGRPINEMSWKGERAISLNAYIYRKRGVLIGYVLCSRCGRTVMEAGKRTPLHTTIETNLKEAYERHMTSFN